jgi:hypothetical protein
MTNSPESHALYQGILKMVLWGEDREAVFDRLRVNGVDGAEAEGIYLSAHRERVATFREEFKTRISHGILIIGAGIAIFCGCWYGLGFIYTRIIAACGVLVAVGFWKLINGVIGTLTAATRPGSVADDF